jgi:hypothetical protein
MKVVIQDSQCSGRYSKTSPPPPASRQKKTGPWGPGSLRLRIFSTSGTVKVVRSSPLRTGRLYPQEFPGTHF